MSLRTLALAHDHRVIITGIQKTKAHFPYNAKYLLFRIDSIALPTICPSRCPLGQCIFEEGGVLFQARPLMGQVFMWLLLEIDGRKPFLQQMMFRRTVQCFQQHLQSKRCQERQELMVTLEKGPDSYFEVSTLLRDDSFLSITQLNNCVVYKQFLQKQQ